MIEKSIIYNIKFIKNKKIENEFLHNVILKFKDIKINHNKKNIILKLKDSYEDKLLSLLNKYNLNYSRVCINETPKANNTTQNKMPNTFLDRYIKKMGDNSTDSKKKNNNVFEFIKNNPGLTGFVGYFLYKSLKKKKKR